MMLYFLFSFFIHLCKSIDDINCDISKGPVIIDSNTLKCDSLSSSKNIENGQKVVISGKSTTNYISTTNAATTLYFKNLDINYDSAVSINGGNVKILFEGMNIIKSGDNAGIKCYNSAKIKFSNGTQDDNHQSCTLKVSSDTYTGIGNDYEVSNCSKLTFLGGKIEATGGIWGAGIGTGLGSDKYGGNVGKIKIVSGIITATGGRYAAGIGCGRGQAAYSSNVDKIEIYGGTVSGTSLEYGAGIGAGFGNGDNSASVTSLFIYGGEVTARGGKYGSGVGGGYGFGSNSASVNEITLSGSSKVENSKSDFTLCTSLVANGGENSQKGVGNGQGGQATKVNTDTSNLNCNNKYCDFKAESNCGRPWKCSSSSQSDCPQCEDGYELISGQCNKVGGGGDDGSGDDGSGDDGSGGDKPPIDGGEGCTSATPMGICLKCKPGYKLIDGKCNVCPSDNHCIEYSDECYCSKCESPYHLNEGSCTLCNVQFCSIINDDCTCKECINGYILESSSICRSCGVSHCKYFINGCECSICESGFYLENGHCSQCESSNCDIFVHEANTCSCSLCAEGYKSFNGLCEKVKDNYYDIPSFVYCTDEKDFRCTEFTEDWSIRKNYLVNRIHDLLLESAEPTNPNDRSKNLAYRLIIEDIRNSNKPVNAKQDINSQLKNLKTNKEKIIIYQFGSMNSGYSYDFSKLRKKFDISIICMDSIIYGARSSVSINSGKLKNVRSLSIYLGEVNIRKGTLKVENLALIASPPNNKATVESDYFLIDSYSLTSLDLLSLNVDKFAVFFPEKGEWSHMTFNNNRQVLVQPGNYPSVTVPTNIGKDQTTIVTYATDIMLQSDSVKQVKDSLNISVHSHNDPVIVEFVGNEWSNTKLKENILVETDDINLVKVRGKPKSGKVLAAQRFDETKNYPRPKKLSNGAIAGIVVAILVLIAAVVWIIIFIFFVIKPKDDQSQTDRSMKASNDLFKPVFQDTN